MKTIKQTYLIHASVEQVWQALTDPTLIDAWGGGPATMDDQVGTPFSFWGGEIHGTNLEVVQHEKLVQGWYSGEHKQATKVTFTLSSTGANTQVDLLHENVPDSIAKSIDDGWKRYYLGPMKEYLEK